MNVPHTYIKMTDSLYLRKLGSWKVTNPERPKYSDLKALEYLTVKGSLEILGVIIAENGENYDVIDAKSLTKLKTMPKCPLFENTGRLCAYRNNDLGTKMIIEEVYPGGAVLFEMNKLVVNNETDYSKPIPNGSGGLRGPYKPRDETKLGTIKKDLPTIKINLRDEFVITYLSSINGDFYDEYNIIYTVYILYRDLKRKHVINVKQTFKDPDPVQADSHFYRNPAIQEIFSEINCESPRILIYKQNDTHIYYDLKTKTKVDSGPFIKWRNADEVIEYNLGEYITRLFTSDRTTKEVCSICLNSLESGHVAAIVPCGHAGFHHECVKGLKECPMCRTEATKILRLYK